MQIFSKSLNVEYHIHVELLIKLTQYLKALKTSSINNGIDPINFDMNMIKNKLVYTILSLNLIDGVFLL